MYSPLGMLSTISSLNHLPSMELTIQAAVLKRILILFLVVLLGRFFYKLIKVRMKVRRFMRNSGLVRNDNASLGYNAGLTNQQLCYHLTVQ